MTAFSQHVEPGAQQKTDREVFREVLAALLRSELVPRESQEPLGHTHAHVAGGTGERAGHDPARRVSSEAELGQAYGHLIHAQLCEGQRLTKTGSFTSDLQLDQHSWSDEYYRIFELERSTRPRVEAVRARVHPEDLPLFDAEIQRGIAGSNADFTFRIVTPSGGLKYLRGVARVIEHVDGRPIFMGTVQDVTERKLAEEALQASETELRRANNYLTVAQRLSRTGSFTWDLASNERRWSEEMYRIFELEPGGPVPWASARALIHPDDIPVVEAMRERARKGENFDIELRLIMPRGALKHIHLVGDLLGEAGERRVFVGAVQDVTDRKLAEEGLARARSELQHAARATALSAITASIVHELNQPLAGIITNAGTCLRFLAADPPKVEGAQATAQRTIRDGQRAAEVLKRLRDLFARKPPRNEPLDLNDAAREILLLTSSELQSGRVVLHSDFAADLPAVVGDRVQLQQVILNLVLNAAQAMREVDGRPRDLWLSTAARPDAEVTLSVRDSGVGAAAEDLEQLFNAFYTTKPDGMGVGLSLSRSIIEAHGGRLWASANDGPGLTLSFSLPVPAPH
ncbi:MAG TPA: ATP-binding protein [Polyangiaceae bacterium]|jgi:signal transduction histidine kinase